MKYSVSQSHYPHFKYSIAICGWWLPYWTAQIENTAIITASSVGQHWIDPVLSQVGHLTTGVQGLAQQHTVGQAWDPTSGTPDGLITLHVVIFAHLHCVRCLHRLKKMRKASISQLNSEVQNSHLCYYTKQTYWNKTCKEKIHGIVTILNGKLNFWTKLVFVLKSKCYVAIKSSI